MIKLIIPGRLPSLNEMIDAAKRNIKCYRTMKQNFTEIVAWEAKRQKIPKITEIINPTVIWYLPDCRTDKDNTMAGQKFIFDGPQEAGVLQNDGWRNIGDITHKFEIDRKNTRVEVILQEGEKTC
jgi:hypothetical protein